jgi:hypothetical protein
VIPFVNGALTAIQQGATAEDYDQPAVTGTARWTGNLGVYVAEELAQTDGLDVDEIITTRLEIPYQVGRLVQRGDRLVYTYESASHTRTARNLIRAELVGRVRVILEAA